MADLLHRTDYVIRAEMDIVRHQLLRNSIELHAAHASFVNAHTIRLDSSGEYQITQMRKCLVHLVETLQKKIEQIQLLKRRGLTD